MIACVARHPFHPAVLCFCTCLCEHFYLVELSCHHAFSIYFYQLRAKHSACGGSVHACDLIHSCARSLPTASISIVIQQCTAQRTNAGSLPMTHHCRVRQLHYKVDFLPFRASGLLCWQCLALSAQRSASPTRYRPCAHTFLLHDSRYAELIGPTRP